MEDYVILGSAPWREKGEEENSGDYIKQASMKLEVFTDMLIRIFGEGEDSNYFTLKTFSHELGPFQQIIVYFDDLDEKSVEFANMVDRELPEKWDDIAIYKLKMLGYRVR